MIALASFFQLELDTTAPTIDIKSPSYVSDKEDYVQIRVVGDELLGTYQEFYFIDSEGYRHDFTFDRNENEYIGVINFHNIKAGIGTFYARTTDTVMNLSSLASKTIRVLVGADLKVIVSHDQRSLSIQEYSRQKVIEDVFRVMVLEELQRPIDFEEKRRTIVLKEDYVES